MVCILTLLELRDNSNEIPRHLILCAKTVSPNYCISGGLTWCQKSNIIISVSLVCFGPAVVPSPIWCFVFPSCLLKSSSEKNLLNSKHCSYYKHSSTMFTKGDNFCDFLFPGGQGLPEMGSTLKEFAPRGANSFL